MQIVIHRWNTDFFAKFESFFHILMSKQFSLSYYYLSLNNLPSSLSNNIEIFGIVPFLQNNIP